MGDINCYILCQTDGGGAGLHLETVDIYVGVYVLSVSYQTLQAA